MWISAAQNGYYLGAPGVSVRWGGSGVVCVCGGGGHKGGLIGD